MTITVSNVRSTRNSTGRVRAVAVLDVPALLVAALGGPSSVEFLGRVVELAWALGQLDVGATDPERAPAERDVVGAVEERSDDRVGVAANCSIDSSHSPDVRMPVARGR